MASLEKDGRTWRARITLPDATRGTIGLGVRDERTAREMLAFIGRLEDAALTNTVPDARLLAWANGLSDALQRRLAKWGLIQLVEAAEPAHVRTVGELVDEFTRTCSASPATMAAYRQGLEAFAGHFGRGAALSTIDVRDADGFVAGLRKSEAAPATVAKRLRVIKRLLRTAVRWGWLASNPMEHIQPGKQTNPERLAFIEPEIVERMMEHANPEWRVILALARWGGIRTPSETFALRWEHVDLAGGRLRVPSPKTAGKGKPFRFVPIFPELRGPLEELEAITPAGAEFVITTYRDAGCNLRTQAERIAGRAGVNLPGKFFQNCRASRVTELHRNFGAKHATDWAGHTAAVALSHYMMVSEADWKRAVEVPTGTNTGTHTGIPTGIARDISGIQQAPAKIGTPSKTPENAGISERNDQNPPSRKWAQVDSNYRPRRYQRRALTN